MPPTAAFWGSARQACCDHATIAASNPSLRERCGACENPAPLLLDLRRFHGWTAAALLRDVAWDIRNRKTFSKIAVVGDACWREWTTYAGMLLFRARLKFFRSAEVAKHWLVAEARAPT